MYTKWYVNVKIIDYENCVTWAVFLLCLRWAHNHFCTWGMTLASTFSGLPLFPRSLSRCDMELMSMWTGQSLVMTEQCWQGRKMLRLMEMPASTVRKEHLRESRDWNWHVSFLSTHGEVYTEYPENSVLTYPVNIQLLMQLPLHTKNIILIHVRI